MKTFFLILILTACGSNSGSNSDQARKEGWTDLELNKLKASCTDLVYSEKGSETVTLEKTREACDCLLDQVSYNYSFYQYEIGIADSLFDPFRKQCAKNVGLSWDKANGIHFFDLRDL